MTSNRDVDSRPADSPIAAVETDSETEPPATLERNSPASSASPASPAPQDTNIHVSDTVDAPTHTKGHFSKLAERYHEGALSLFGAPTYTKDNSPVYDSPKSPLHRLRPLPVVPDSGISFRALDEELKPNPEHFKGTQILINYYQTDGSPSSFVEVPTPLTDTLPYSSIAGPPGTKLRWLHMNADALNFDIFTYLSDIYNPEDGIGGLLRTYREERENRSNYGTHFRAGCLNNESTGHKGLFASCNSLRLDKKPDHVQMASLRMLLHKPRTLMQYHYRLVRASDTIGRDEKQTYRKMYGNLPVFLKQTYDENFDNATIILMVKHWWFLKLDDDTIFTATTWSKDANEDEITLDTVYEEGYHYSPYRQHMLRRFRLHDVYDSNEASMLHVKQFGSFRSRLKFFLAVVFYTPFSTKFPRATRLIRKYLASVGLVEDPESSKMKLDEYITIFTQMYETANSLKDTLKEFEKESQSTASLHRNFQTLARMINRYIRYINDFKKRQLYFQNNEDLRGMDKLERQIREGIIDYKMQVLSSRSSQTSHKETDTAGCPLAPLDTTDLLTNAVELALQPESCKELSDIYAKYLARLQFSAQKDPTKELYQNINELGEEVEAISNLTKSQLNFLRETAVALFGGTLRSPGSNTPHQSQERFLSIIRRFENFEKDLKYFSTRYPQVLRMTAQQVELRMEYNNKAILVFTIVTIIFLPMSFVSSFFGMNVSDLRNMVHGQWIFWATGLGFTVLVSLVSLVLAFHGERMWNAVKRKGAARGAVTGEAG